MKTLVVLCGVLFSVCLSAQELIDANKPVFVINAIPPSLQGRLINDHRDLDDVLGKVTCTGVESFVYQQTEHAGNYDIYVYGQRIHGHITRYQIDVWVDVESKLVTRFAGVVRKANGLSTKPAAKPAVSREVAIGLVLDYLAGDGKRVWEVPMVLDDTGNHTGELIYKDDELWWGIGIELQSSPQELEGVEINHEWFYVSPEKAVSPLVERASSHLEVEVCDERNAVNSFGEPVWVAAFARQTPGPRQSPRLPMRNSPAGRI